MCTPHISIWILILPSYMLAIADQGPQKSCRISQGTMWLSNKFVTAHHYNVGIRQHLKILLTMNLYRKVI